MREQPLFVGMAPDGVPGEPRDVWVKLLKTVDGLVDGTREWRNCFLATSRGLGFETSVLEPCVLVLRSPQQGYHGIIGVAVDDIAGGGDEVWEQVVMYFILIFLWFETQAMWLRIDKLTLHQCWNVCDWETEKDQPSGAQPSLPTCTQRKSGNQSSDCGHHTFEKMYTSYSQPSKLFTRTRWHGTRSRGNTMCKLYFPRTQTSPLNSEGHVMHFLPFLYHKTRSGPEPDTSPFDFMHFLAQHVQGFVAAQSYLCHLPVLKEEGDCVAGSLWPDDEQRVITPRCFHPSCHRPTARNSPRPSCANRSRCFHFFRLRCWAQAEPAH